MKNVNKVLDILEETYPEAKCELDYTTPFELLVATILSAQCTDVRVNKVTGEMFKKYNTLFLYKYNPKDIYYNTDEYVNGTYFPEKDSTAAGLFDVPSDEALRIS